MEENHQLLLHPLLNPSTTSTSAVPPLDDQPLNDVECISSNSSIIFRISLVAVIGLVSLWANHEASKGYAITIVNESGDTVPGKRFQLFYVSNDEATRTLIRASQTVENLLYLDSDDSNANKKQVEHIILKLAGQNLAKNVIVDSVENHEFVITISPSIMESTDFKHNVFLAVQQGVTRTWLWDGQGKVPENLVNGVVEYVTRNLGRSDTATHPYSTAYDGVESCWNHKDSRQVAEFLNYCERRGPGFIRKLNQAMKEGWDDGKLDGLLGQPVQKLCTTYYESLRYNFSSV